MSKKDATSWLIAAGAGVTVVGLAAYFLLQGVKAYTPPLKFISRFDGGVGNEWMNVSGISTDDIVNVKSGTRSVKMLANNPATHRIRLDIPTPIDLRNVGHFYLRTHSPTPELLTTHLIYFCKDVSNHFSAWAGPKMQMWPDTEEWFEWGISKPSFFKTGTVEWNEISFILIDAYSIGAADVEVTFDELSYCENARSRGCVSIWVDDGENGAYDYAKPALDKYGYKLSMAWNADNRGGISKLQALKNEGHEISCHGYSHIDWTTLTDEQLHNNITDWFTTAESFGLLRAPYIGCPPIGAMTYDLGHKLLNYFTLVRSASSFGTQTWPFPSAFNQYANQVDNTNLAAMQGTIDAVAANRLQWNIIFHMVGPTASYWTQELFEQLIDYIYSKGVDVKTYSQLLAEGW